MEDQCDSRVWFGCALVSWQPIETIGEHSNIGEDQGKAQSVVASEKIVNFYCAFDPL